MDQKRIIADRRKLNVRKEELWLTIEL